MSGIGGFALFCEDIREEVGGTETLVGVLGGGVLLPELPFKFSKLGIYVRIQFAENWTSWPIRCLLTQPDGKSIEIGVIEHDSFARRSTRPGSDGVVGVTLAAARAIEAREEGYLVVSLAYDDQKADIGSLEIRLSTEAIGR
jgi:hypothetical protein